MLARLLKTLGVQIFVALGILILTPELFKALGADDFGILSLCLSGLVLLNYVNFGIPQAVFKYLGADNPIEDKVRFFVSSVQVNILVGICISGLFYIAHVIFSLPKFLDSLSTWLMLLIPVVMGIMVVRSALEGQNSFGFASLLRGGTNFSYFLFPFLGIKNEELNFWLLMHLAFTVILLSLSLWHVSKKMNISFTRVHFCYESVLEVLKSGTPFFVVSLSAIGLYYSDRMILPAFESLAAVGIYLLVYDLITRQSIVYGALSQILFLDVQKKMSNSLTTSSAITAVSRFCKPFLYLQVVALVMCILLSDYWTGYLGISFDDVKYVLLLIWVGIYFNVVCTLFYKVLIAYDLEKSFASFSVKEVMLVLPLMFVSIYFFGTIGASVVYLIRSSLEAFIALRILGATQRQILNILLPLLVVSPALGGALFFGVGDQFYFAWISLLITCLLALILFSMLTLKNVRAGI
ncbi:oligosaccharide flippase family protein [Ferrimonas futtsuensis]|uniref:oligosaccharide flippase family protein n=1 Tax=Ferrimonas futtsuensis TaxID=364764 RepID=UPI0004074E81|nr:oligosaccharide flippase family protein [Ferrimonas futtsuensis]